MTDWLTVPYRVPDRAAVEAWYASPEYAEALAFRSKALSRNLICVDGVGTHGSTRVETLPGTAR